MTTKHWPKSRTGPWSGWSTKRSSCPHITLKPSRKRRRLPARRGRPKPTGVEGDKASVRSEIGLLRHQLFSDDITEAKNRLWVYKQKLNERQGFNDFGYVVSIRVADYAMIIKEYDANVGSKLLKMVSDYMIGYLKENHIAFEIARFSKEQFLIFIHDMGEDEVEELIANMQKGMGHYAFKHRNRIFRLSMDAVAVQYIKNEPFASVMEQLEEKRFLSGG